jgi:hypothetical protein
LSPYYIGDNHSPQGSQKNTETYGLEDVVTQEEDYRCYRYHNNENPQRPFGRRQGIKRGLGFTAMFFGT